jgi:hypothetical protein
MNYEGRDPNGVISEAAIDADIEVIRGKARCRPAPSGCGDLRDKHGIVIPLDKSNLSEVDAIGAAFDLMEREQRKPALARFEC